MLFRLCMSNKCVSLLKLKAHIMKITQMKELIELLEQIDTDYYKGFYTVGERYDLIKGINEVLTNQKFI